MKADVDAQVQSIVTLYREAGLEEGSGVVPTAKQWKALLENPHQGKIFVVTFYKLDPHLAKENVPDLSTDDYKKFIEENNVGEVALLDGITLCNFIGADEDWDFVSAFEFPSRESLVKLMSNPKFVELNKVRPKMMSKQWTVILQPYDP